MSLQFCLSVGWLGLVGLGDRLGVELAVSGAGLGPSEFDIFDPEMGHTALAIAITQLHALGGANAIMGVSADPAVFALPAVPGTMGYTVAAPGLVQLHNLIAVNADQGHTATVAVQGVVLVGVAATMGHTADMVTDISQEVGAMGVGSPIMGHTADAGDVHENKIVPVGATMGNVAGG
jgi:hypothetical protein